MVYTTLKKLREAGACEDRYAHLVEALEAEYAVGTSYPDNKPIFLTTILDTNGLDDVLWIPERALSGDHIERRYRLFAVACCQEILHLMKDQRSRDAVRVAHLFAYGEATKKELAAACDAAWAAAGATAAWSIARDTAAWAIARDTAWATAWAIARDTAWATARATAAWAIARDTAWATAAWAIARDTARKRQSDIFRVVFSADYGDE